MSDNPNAKAAVLAIVTDLTGRKGLRDEWDQIDPEVRDEIVAKWEDLMTPWVQDTSGIDPAGVSEGMQRTHDVIRIEPRERLVNGLVAWACLENIPMGASFVLPDWPDDDPRWDLMDEMPSQWSQHRLAALFADTGDALDVRRATVLVRHIQEGHIQRVQAAQFVGGFAALAYLEGLVE